MLKTMVLCFFQTFFEDLANRIGAAAIENEISTKDDNSTEIDGQAERGIPTIVEKT